MSNIEDVKYKVAKFWLSAGRAGLAHYRSAERAETNHMWLGLPTVAVCAFVATSIFATLGEINIIWQILTGIVALTSVVLTAIQNFLNFDEKIRRHQQTGAKYQQLRREIDILYLKIQNMTYGDAIKALEEMEIPKQLLEFSTDITLSEEMYKIGAHDFDKVHQVEIKKYGLTEDAHLIKKTFLERINITNHKGRT